MEFVVEENDISRLIMVIYHSKMKDFLNVLYHRAIFEEGRCLILFACLVLKRSYLKMTTDLN
jgi:hypothetical protein